ncbi:MAG TPA: tRNA 4-thiouridine(8) synthase ThiI, partial [Nanoarchaeota archaeon]|nr:tRNA 4-thiouridine(8) synthase ThiI [Nanoarchaeota archaeon]
KVDERVELVLFRNFMLRIAQEIALRDGYSAIITGDSLGQVASQTGENLLAANFGVEIPVFRPLISFDKEEIVEIARKIGTFDLSVEKYKDCCSIISRKPATAVRPEKFRKELSKVDLQGIIAKTLEEIEVQKIT